MAYFKGNVVPPTYKRISKFISENPQYNKWKEGDQFYGIMTQSLDLIDDGIDNDSVTQLIPITGISVSTGATELDLVEGGVQTVQIVASPVPTSPTENYTIGYSSSDEAIATVSSTGVVTAVAVGSATITVSIEADAGTFSDTVDITVVDTTE